MSTTIAVDGLSREHRERTVATAIEAISGVTGVTVDRTTGTVMVDGEADVNDLVAAIEDAGYEAAV
jgi:copper chaperone CopZ